MHDEPVLEPSFDARHTPRADRITVVEQIRDLVAGEPFAVLCTQGEGQPYGSVVAFAFDQEIRRFAFATPKATRKYRLLTHCDRVALVVDNRGSFPGDLMQVSAVTITGRARQVQPGTEFEEVALLLTERHPYLASFVKSPSTALFSVEAVRFLHVTRFQEVSQWIPASDG